MNAFDDWLEARRKALCPAPRHDWDDEDMLAAFNAGLEAAALKVERLKRGYGSERHDESCTLAIETIRALKDSSTKEDMK